MEMHMERVLKEIAAGFSSLGAVRAVAVSGSVTGGIYDRLSDRDIYVYADELPSAEERRHILKSLSPDSLLVGQSFFEPGDEMAADGMVYDIMYRDAGFASREIERVWIRHQPSLGYSTCFLFNLQRHHFLFDRDGRMAREVSVLSEPYPEELAQRIISYNAEMMTGPLSSNWMHQLEHAVARDDAVSVNHRLAALMASYFDILFASGRVLHPGEKKLIPYAHLLCSRLPESFDEDMKAVFSASGEELLENVGRAVRRLFAIV